MQLHNFKHRHKKAVCVITMIGSSTPHENLHGSPSNVMVYSYS